MVASVSFNVFFPASLERPPVANDSSCSFSLGARFFSMSAAANLASDSSLNFFSLSSALGPNPNMAIKSSLKKPAIPPPIAPMAPPTAVPIPGITLPRVAPSAAPLAAPLTALPILLLRSWV